MTTINAETGNCPHCGCIHIGRCPQVRAIEYYPNGTVKRVEFTTPEPLVTIKTDPWKPPFETTWCGGTPALSWHAVEVDKIDVVESTGARWKVDSWE